MTARHAGAGRIADTALIDQVRAAARDMRANVFDVPGPIDHHWLANWAGRALALLEQIGEMGE